MAIRYTRVGGGPVGGDAYLQMARKVNPIFDEELEPVGEEGAREARRLVDTSGTGRAWNGSFKGRKTGAPSSGGDAGRDDSGDMRDDLNFRVLHGKGSGIDVGWIHNYEKYYGAQEKGFNAPGYRVNPQFVAGMGIFEHLRTFLRVRVDEAVDRAERRILDGL